jgi:hypothetical protein
VTDEFGRMRQQAVVAYFMDRLKKFTKNSKQFSKYRIETETSELQSTRAIHSTARLCEMQKRDPHHLLAFSPCGNTRDLMSLGSFWPQWLGMSYIYIYIAGIDPSCPLHSLPLQRDVEATSYPIANRTVTTVFIF